MFVLGTAGHVDHGKSVLVRALTGIDPDRLPVEKERGMTTDLGFAWLKLPSGREVSLIDVPGHIRFIKNMLAGVGGIDLALLVVAADEGIMPQTTEHLAILDLLRVDQGIVVITKKDLVDEELLELVNLEVAEAVKGTTLSQAPVLPVSALTGEGLPELIATIDRLLDRARPRRDVGRPRLPVDRVFTISGFGTVVTGTLIDGCLATGQEVEILPPRLGGRIRGLQTHRQKAPTAQPGSRVAVNLSGVAAPELSRGYVVTTPGWLAPTRALDARLRLIHPPRPLRHNTTVTFHIGASEVEARVRLLDRERLEPWESAWVQFYLAREIAVVKGDLFIVRSPQETLGGGEVVVPHASRHRRSHQPTLSALEAWERGSPREVILTALELGQSVQLGDLIARANLSVEAAEAAVRELAREGRLLAVEGRGVGSLQAEPSGRSLLFSLSNWQRLARKAEAATQEYHRRFPLRQAMPLEELRSRLGLAAAFFPSTVEGLCQQGALVQEASGVRLLGHRVQLTPEQQGTIAAFLHSLAQSPYSPPGELLEPELLNYLVREGQVVKVSQNIVFLTSAYEEMVARIKGHISSRGRITLAEVRDLFHTSRKYAQALLEYLDEQKITRRTGDERVLVGRD